MSMVSFIIDPIAAKTAVLNGKCLKVDVYGERHQYHRVTVVNRPAPSPIAEEAAARAEAAFEREATG